MAKPTASEKLYGTTLSAYGVDDDASPTADKDLLKSYVDLQKIRADYAKSGNQLALKRQLAQWELQLGMLKDNNRTYTTLVESAGKDRRVTAQAAVDRANSITTNRTRLATAAAATQFPISAAMRDGKERDGIVGAADALVQTLNTTAPEANDSRLSVQALGNELTRIVNGKTLEETSVDEVVDALAAKNASPALQENIRQFMVKAKSADGIVRQTNLQLDSDTREMTRLGNAIGSGKLSAAEEAKFMRDLIALNDKIQTNMSAIVTTKDEAALEAERAVARKQDALYDQLDKDVDQLRERALGGSSAATTLRNSVGSIISDPNFRAWAESNGYKIGEAKVVDGNVVYSPGRDDQKAVVYFDWQLKHPDRMGKATIPFFDRRRSTGDTVRVTYTDPNAIADMKAQFDLGGGRYYIDKETNSFLTAAEASNLPEGRAEIINEAEAVELTRNGMAVIGKLDVIHATDLQKFGANSVSLNGGKLRISADQNPVVEYLPEGYKAGDQLPLTFDQLRDIREGRDVPGVRVTGRAEKPAEAPKAAEPEKAEKVGPQDKVFRDKDFEYKVRADDKAIEIVKAVGEIPMPKNPIILPTDNRYRGAVQNLMTGVQNKTVVEVTNIEAPKAPAVPAPTRQTARKVAEAEVRGGRTDVRYTGAAAPAPVAPKVPVTVAPEELEFGSAADQIVVEPAAEAAPAEEKKAEEKKAAAPTPTAPIAVAPAAAQPAAPKPVGKKGIEALTDAGMLTAQSARTGELLGVQKATAMFSPEELAAMETPKKPGVIGGLFAKLRKPAEEKPKPLAKLPSLSKETLEKLAKAEEGVPETAPRERQGRTLFGTGEETRRGAERVMLEQGRKADEIARQVAERKATESAAQKVEMPEQTVAGQPAQPAAKRKPLDAFRRAAGVPAQPVAENTEIPGTVSGGA